MIIIKLILNGLVVLIAARLLSGVEVKNYWHALLTAVLLAVANAFVKPILTFFSLPLIILTLGLFNLVISAIIILLVDAILPGFKVKGFKWAVIFAIILWILNGILNFFIH